MARETTVRLVDDINGEPAAETVAFALDGRDYMIDLSETHAKELRSALEPFRAAARRPTTGPAKARRQPARGNREHNQAVRDWARQQGINIGDRGRIPVDVQLRFDAAHASR